VTQQPREKNGSRRLKVVHLTTMDSGGAGKAAYRLHQGLQRSGVDSTMLVVSRKLKDPSVRVVPVGQVGGVIDCPEEYPPNQAFAQKSWNHWSSIIASYPNHEPGIEIFSDDYSEISLDCSREIREADIVNLHWVAGFVNWMNAARALKGKRIVWTMHDMNPFTGGCHYAGECTRFLEGCGACPMLGSKDDTDVSRSMWEYKKFAYGKLDLHPVAPSRWLAETATKSSLLSPFPARVLPNGFPTDVFVPSAKREEVRRSYGVPEGAKVVLFGADTLIVKRKGFIYLLQALSRMAGKNIHFAFFGNLPDDVLPGLNLPLIRLGYVQEESALAALYSMADLFVIPSIEDNLPNTVVEAMLCGVPVVGFNIGGIPDMVQHKKTGYLVPPRDVAGLVEAIDWCLFHPDAAGMGGRCREIAAARYSMEAQAANYTALYREILGLSSADTASTAATRIAAPPATHTAPAIAAAAQSTPTASAQLSLAPRDRAGVRASAGSATLPRISVVIPSYNYGRYLEACLDSILSQDYPNLELIVLDGGSSDNTVEILRRYERHLSFWRSEPDAGQYSAIEEGLNRSTGEIIGWLNADDMFHPGAFDAVARIFSRQPEVEWLMGRPNSFDETGEQKHVLSHLPMNSRAKYLKDEELIQQEGVFWRRGLWERSGAYIDKGLPLAADLELWARFFRSARLFSVDTLIAGFRDHPLQKSKDKAGYTAEANRVLAREQAIFAREVPPFSPPAPLPILLDGDRVIM